MHEWICSYCKRTVPLADKAVIIPRQLPPCPGETWPRYTNDIYHDECWFLYGRQQSRIDDREASE